jgi:predicted transcriptional regulator
MSRRTNLEIMAEIIEFCRQPRSKTRIMYAMNLSFTAMRNYISALETMAFIEVHHSRPKCQTTQRGIVFLKKWKEMNELMNGEFMGEGPQILTQEPSTLFSTLRNSYPERLNASR